MILDGEADLAIGAGRAVAYHVFDVLWLDGRDVTSLPLDAAPRAAAPVCRFARRCSASPRSTSRKPWERACARAGKA